MILDPQLLHFIVGSIQNHAVVSDAPRPNNISQLDIRCSFVQSNEASDGMADKCLISIHYQINGRRFKAKQTSFKQIVIPDEQGKHIHAIYNIYVGVKLCTMGRGDLPDMYVRMSLRVSAYISCYKCDLA